ncbi:hypothetical protein C8R47DRAFT_1146277 [Mycena vitilis]|nr:hypothetical protein C8R47DRAFT_1146277 [Mycena vitilis]
MASLVLLIFVQLFVAWMSTPLVALSIGVDETDNARRSPDDHEHLPFVHYPGDDTEYAPIALYVCKSAYVLSILSGCSGTTSSKQERFLFPRAEAMPLIPAASRSRKTPRSKESQSENCIGAPYIRKNPVESCSPVNYVGPYRAW